MTTMWNTIEQFLATPPYHACLLLVHSDMMRLETAVSQIIHRYHWPVLSVGAVISQTLVPVSTTKRPNPAAKTLATTIHHYQPGPLLCADISLLFEPSLNLDPLPLLLDASRQTQLIVAWPGTFTHHTLAYATAAHAHYRTWTQPDLCEHCIFVL